MLFNTVFLSFQWVYNILDHKSEVDRIVIEDLDPSSGFVLVPDLKWDSKDIKSLYLLAIVRKTGIKSLRDLTEEHLPLLRNILNKCLVCSDSKTLIKYNYKNVMYVRDYDCFVLQKVIKEQYGLPSSRIRAFLHYQPTFYHLHIHFTYLQYDAPGK